MGGRAHRLLLVADGASVHTARLMDGLAQAGLDAHLATFEIPEEVSGSAYRLGSLPPRFDLRYVLAVPALTRLIRRIRPAIVNAHYLTSYGAMAALATRLLPRDRRPRLIQTVWGSDVLVTPTRSELHRRAARRWLGWADLVTGDSEDLRSGVAALAPSVPWHAFLFGPEQRLLGAPRRTQAVVLSARRHEPDMRIGLIIEAFRQVRQTNERDCRLVITGSGSMEGELKRLAAGIPGVEFTGHLDRPRLHELLGAAQVAVSVPESDGTSAALLDALAAGVTPVVNDLPANREWVDSSIGFVVSRDPDPGELARAMAAALARESDSALIRRVVADHTWEAELSRLVGRIEQLVSGS